MLRQRLPWRGVAVLAVAVSALGAVPLTTFAQTAPRDPNMPDPRTTVPEKIRPQDPDVTGSTDQGGSLSDRLKESEGVIRPPTTATPDMTVRPPVPNPGTTPVIPPPGTSPTDPVQPK